MLRMVVLLILSFFVTLPGQFLRCMYSDIIRQIARETIYSHRRVHFERFGLKVRQRTLLNLGHHFAVEQIGLLKENSQGIGQHHQIELVPDDNGQNAK